MLKMFAVYDSKAEAYLTPFFMKARGEALRGFQDVSNDPKTSFYKHAGDYTLFELGEYDEFSGSYIEHKAKISLGSANEFKKEMAV